MFNLFFCYVLLSNEHYKWVLRIIILWLDDYDVVMKMMRNWLIIGVKMMIHLRIDIDDNDDGFEHVEDDDNFRVQFF